MNVDSASYMSSRSLPCVFGQAGTTPPSPSFIPSTISLHSIEQVLQRSSNPTKSSDDSPMSAGGPSSLDTPKFRHFADHASLTSSISYDSGTSVYSTSRLPSQNGQSVIAVRSRKPIVSPSFSKTLPQGQYFIFPDVPSSTIELSHSLASTTFSGTSPDSSGTSFGTSLTHILDMPSSTSLNNFPPKTATGSDTITTESPSVQLPSSSSSGTLTPSFQLVNLRTTPLPGLGKTFNPPPPLQLQSDNARTGGCGHPGSPQVLTLPPREKQMSNPSFAMDSIVEVDSEVSSSVDIISETSLYRTTSADVELTKDEFEASTDTAIVRSSPNPSENPVACGIEVTSIDNKTTKIYEPTPPFPHCIILTKENVDDNDELESSSVTEFFFHCRGKTEVQAQNKHFAAREDNFHEVSSLKQESEANSALVDFETEHREGFASKARLEDKVQSLEFPCTLEEIGRAYEAQQKTSHGSSNGPRSKNVLTTFSDNVHTQPDQKREAVNCEPSAQARLKPNISIPLALSLNQPNTHKYERHSYSNSSDIDSSNSFVLPTRSKQGDLSQAKRSSASDSMTEIWTTQIANLKPIPILNSPRCASGSDSSQFKLSSPRLTPTSSIQSTTKANINKNDHWNEIDPQVSQSFQMASGSQQTYVAKSPTTVAKPNIKTFIHDSIQVRPHTAYQQTDI